MKKQQLYLLGAITIIGFPLVGFTINHFFGDKPFGAQIYSEYSWFYQIVVGIVYGLISGFLCWFVLQTNFMKPSRKKYIHIIRAMKLDWSDIIFISICAGVGEEILFRGVLQQFLESILLQSCS